MYEKLEECPACKHTQFTNHLICQDHLVSKESFALVQCTKCHLVFTNPRPSQSNISRYYEHESYISHTNKANSITNIIYKLVRRYTLNQKSQLIKRHNSGTRILDFGSGTGTFAQHMHSLGYETEGFEPSNTAIQLARKNSSIEYIDTIDFLKKRPEYDIITAWHVIEHVHELKSTIKQLRKLLRSNGKMFIALPNRLSYDAAYYKENWAAYDVPRHLYHFDRSSFENLAIKSKLQIIDIVPMKFDAYYVSLLSQNILGNPSFIKSFRIGSKSNTQARSTGEYSSLIYVLSK